jgi:hypothetical protein
MFKKIEGIYTAAKQAFKKNPNPGEVIKSVKTNVPDTKLKKLQAANRIAELRLKGAQAKLKQTNYEIANKAFKGKDDFTFAKSNKKSETNRERYKRIQKENTESIKKMIDTAFAENKAKGGRVGLKGGSFPDLSGDGKTTFKDILIGRGVIKKGKKDKKTKTPIQKAVKKNKKKKVI